MNRIAIIGGGAAGLMAAIAASENSNVTIFEKKDRVGKKILVTGNGRCNFTNANLSADYYYCSDDAFVNKALEKFDNKDLITFFKGLGLLVKDKNGYFYPASEQASSVLDVLRIKVNSLGINVSTDCEVTKIMPLDKGFGIYTSDGKYEFDKVIIATGGRSSLSKNERANGYDLCKKLGLSVTNLYPALTQLKAEGLNFKAVSGVRQECSLTVNADGYDVMIQRGEILFAEYGISGIVTFQVSHLAAMYLDEGKKVTAKIDLLPDLSDEDVKTFTVSKYLVADRISVEEFFAGFLNKKINVELIKLAGLKPSGCICDYSCEDIVKVALLMKHLTITICGTNGYENSQVTGGGVELSEVNENMECNKIPGLYVVGELLDVDGICGGYNLQWAFTSGNIAGNHAKMNERQKPCY